MEKLIDDFEKSLFNPVQPVVIDLTELSIDSLMDDGILKDLPIVSTIIGVLKISKNIHDRNLLKQTLNFINEFNSNQIDEYKLNNYKKLVETDSKKCEEELGRVLLLLDRFIDKEKSIMLAKIFKAYVEEFISWSEFCEYSEIINRLFIQDMSLLKKIYDGVVNDTSDITDTYRVERLNSLGIIGLSFKSTKISVINGIRNNRQDSYLTMNNNGEKFMNIISK